ncbi:MAG: roadblock/LC7 domain-containing protein, partial [Candidatus Hodarchaeota archaeon]
AISASLISLGEKSITEMKKGKFDHIYIKSSDGYLLAMQAGSEAILTVSTTKDARLGLLILDCKRTCDKIANLVNREI